MGWHVPSSRDIVIAVVIGPGPAAKHEPTRFVPDGAWTDDQVAEVYASSGRLITYVGDWHSHPAGSTSLSWRDTRTLKSIAGRPAARCPQPVMLIAAGTPGDWRYVAYALRKQRRPAPWATQEFKPRIFTPNSESVLATVECRCSTLISALRGNEAEDYASAHLRKAWVNKESWTKGYECPETSHLWLMEYPASHLQGSASQTLRPASPVEWRAAQREG